MSKWNKFPRFVLVLMLLIGLCAGLFAPHVGEVEAKPNLLPATNVVISEFRFRGDGGGDDEFIELYNPTSSSVEISGWLIRGSNSSGTISTRATIPTTTILQAGQYYLITHNTGYSGTATANLTYATGITSDGGVALTLADTTTIIDQVGLSASSAYKEGTALAELTTNVDRGYERRLGGSFDSCEDDNNNSIDFQLINPSTPQNLSSPKSLCGVSSDLSIIKSVDNPSQSVGGNVTFTITVSNAAGFDDATNVTVRDLLPSGLNYVSSSFSDLTDTYNSGTGIWIVGTLANGTSATLDITATVDSVAPKVNVAEVWGADQVDTDSTPANGITEDDYDDVTVTPPPAPLNITNVVNNPTQSIGSNVIFTITVTNPYAVSASGVAVNALLPTGLTYQSHSTATGTYMSGTGIWTIGTLTASGGSATLTVTARVTTPGLKNYSATVTSNELSNNTATATVTPPPQTLALNITNTVNNINPNVGANVVFTITVSNPHTFYGSNVNVSAQLPANLTYVSHSTATGTYTSGTGIWSIGNLAANVGSATLTVTATVATSGVKNYSATVSSNEFLNSTATATVTPIGSTQADLNLTQTPTWRRSTTAADTAIISIRVTNEDAVLASNVQVRALLPSGLTYVSHSSGQTYNSTTGIWAVGTVPSGGNVTLEITVRVSASGTSTTYVAEIWQADQFDDDSIPANGNTSEDDYYTNEVLVADLSLTQTVDIAGSNAVFTLRVTNSGPDDATIITVDNSRLHQPSSYIFISSSSSAYDDATGIWSIPFLAEGATATLVVTTTIVSPNENWAEINNVREVDPDSRPDNNSRTEDDDAASPSADLSLTQTIVSPSPYNNSEIDSNVTFRITVTNSGFANAGNVEVKDLLPAGLTYVSHTSGQNYNKTTGIWVVGNLPVGVPRYLDITAKVTSFGIRTNWAEVWRSAQSDPDSDPGDSSRTSDDDDSATITSFRSVIINEIAWSGTNASTNDEWIELYNPSDTAITITDWEIRKDSCNNSTGTDYITLSGSIAKDGYFLLERDDNETVSDISANQIYHLDNNGPPLEDTGETLYLCDNFGNFIDTANRQGEDNNVNPWPQGDDESPRPSMERRNNSTENDTSWSTNNGVTKNGLNANGGAIYGTPGKKNTATTTTNTPAPATATSVPIPVIPPRPIINEILPRPGFDWNQDGRVDVFDEFIEIKNLTAIDITLNGWKLDKDSGRTTFALPNVTLKPNERIVFYSLQTNLLLSDGGETIRLINSAGKIYDAYTYTIARAEDESFCRLPDGRPSDSAWFDDCIPTPGQTNTREGTIPSSPNGENESFICDLPDTLHPDFFFAECKGYGDKIWNPFYWDQLYRVFIESNTTKWESFIE